MTLEEVPSLAAAGAPRLPEVLRLIDDLASRSPAEDTTPAPLLATVFHSSAMPEIPLPEYARRIAYYTGYGVEGLCVGLALMRRYAHATGTQPTRLMLHRLLLAAVTLGMKACSDRFLPNSTVAHIGGVPLEELNQLEGQLFRDLGHAAIPTQSECSNALVHALYAPYTSADAHCAARTVHGFPAAVVLAQQLYLGPASQQCRLVKSFSHPQGDWLPRM